MTFPSKMFSIAGGRITCRQCHAKCKATGEQCRKPALHGKAVCQVHGGRGGRPITHGAETRALRAARPAVTRQLRELEMECLRLGLFKDRKRVRA